MVAYLLAFGLGFAASKVDSQPDFAVGKAVYPKITIFSDLLAHC